jgi:aldose sugar dehydrogenase
MKSVLPLILVLLLVSACQSPLAQDETTLIEGLRVPWSIDFLPGGELIFTERNGRISIFNGDERRTVADIPVGDVTEAGMHGVTLHPNFENNRLVYLYYATENDNRVVRYVLGEQLQEDMIILSGIPLARIHNGGALKFGPDGLLYITTGDAAEPSLAQDLNSLAGKILRINDDGSIPEDNPFGNQVFSYGHRNPQGLAWIGDQLYSSEHGPSRHDEVNLIVAGGNYGWPQRCDEQGEETILPIRCYTDFTLAPASLDSDGNILYVAGLRGTQIRKLAIENSEVVGEEEIVSDKGRIRALAIRDGVLYYGTSNYDGRGVPRQGDDRIIALSLN